MTRPRLRLCPLLAWAALLGAPPLQGAEEPTAPAAQRYTFTWPIDAQTQGPRGGSTKGVPVQIDTAPSAAWRELQAPGLSAFERDRRAILALAGSYRVSFDFLEIVDFTPRTRDRPYQSWGTERVYVDSDTGRGISLVHLLEMRMLQADGSVSEPMVTKHWREDWEYEPKRLVEYRGNERWQRRELRAQDSAGQWVQTVLQVDESPRYASLGRWQHSGSFSSWLSGETWRPLPRREWSVRKDYQVLAGTNRVTVTATGAAQEENNLKLAVDAERRPLAEAPYLAREYGVARYERLRDPDFAAADDYYRATRTFWDEVHRAWQERFRAHDVVTLRAPVDQAGLFAPLFDYADQIAAGKQPAVPAHEVIAKSLKDMGAG